ncbi:MAG: lysophospholipid acyltransferase family protein [Planctomycetes bacterium]|nr:lysophospholipid acyltransferase family protein [Planctomycetota bacterium]
MKRIRHLVEYALVRVLLLVVDLLPVRACIFLAHAIGDVIWLVLPGRRRIAVDNILAAGITTEPKAARRLARAVFRQFARVVVESLKSDAWFRKHPMQECVAWHVPPEVDALLADPQAGVILASGHLGNWEIAAQVLSHKKPVVGITRRMNNPYVDRLMLSRKPRHRFELTPKRDANLGRLMGALRDGKVLAIMIDQNAKERGMLVDFFGRPASSHTAIALLHLLTKAPLVFGYCTETAPMRFEFRATGPFRFRPTGDKERDVRAILDCLNRELEAAVRACPDEYMWGHRRWRLPEGHGGGTATRG